MPSFLDEVSPKYIGDDRLRLTLTDPNQVLSAFVPVLVTVDYSRALPEGIVLPLDFSVTGPRGIVVQKVFRRFAPGELSFVPREGGSVLVRVAESYHNQWWGKLVLEIAGDRIRAAT